MMDATTAIAYCRSCTDLAIHSDVWPAVCGDCGKLHAHPRRVLWTPRAERDMAALAAISPIRAIDLDPASKLHGADEPEDLDATVRAERSRHNGRMAARRLVAMRSAHPDGERYARAVWLAWGVRGKVVNERESLAARIASECLAFTPDDWAVVARERARVNARAQERRVKMPDALRVVATILGNAILGCATTAYEHDAWNDWRPRANEDPTPDEPARVRRAKEWRARFDARGEQSA